MTKIGKIPIQISGHVLGNEDQCLRIAWTLYCSHTPKNWKGYDGFKQDAYVPLRNFSIESKEDTKQFLEEFSNGLADISKHYARIVSPKADDKLLKDEFTLLMKISNTGNIANFLPLMVAARKRRESQIISDPDYCDLLKALERYAYRAFYLKANAATLECQIYIDGLVKYSDRNTQYRMSSNGLTH